MTTTTPAPVVAVLGPVEVVRGSEVARVTGTQARLLARLAAGPGVVDVPALTHAVWPTAVPRTARAALANQVSRLRAVHGDGLVVTEVAGYRLGVRTDVEVVADGLAEAESSLATGDARGALGHAEAASGWWRGEPFVDVEHDVTVAAARRHALELGVAVRTVRLAAAIDAGRPGWAVAEGERLVAETPYDEQRWALLARALDRAGRRGDALGAVERARRSLRDGLGLDPGAGLNQFAATLRGDPEPRPTRPGAAVLGREDVLARLLDLTGAGGLVMIRGEEGLGATAVLGELARRLRSRGRVVAQVSCTSTPDVPLAELALLVDELTGAAAGAARALADSFVATVTAMAADRPVALLVDDLHHAGPSTVSALAAVSASAGVTVVASVRGRLDLPASTRVDDVVLAPLDPATTTALVTRHRGDVPDEDAVRWWHTMSGGNPLFLTLLLEAGPDPAAGASQVASLASLVRSQTALLGAAARLALETVAVAGPGPAGSSEVVLRGLVPADGLATALAAGVLERMGDLLRFRHGAVAEVHRNAVAPGRRVELHHAIGGRLETLRGPAAAAEHLLVAADLDPRAAVRGAAAAAVRSGRVGAHLDAARWYGAAADVETRHRPDLPSAALRWRIAHGNELRLAGVQGQDGLLLDAFEQALHLDEPGLVTAAATAALALGTTTESGRAHDGVDHVVGRALAAVRDPEDRARISGAASLAFSMAGEPDRCRQLFDDADALATSPASRRDVLPFAYMALGRPDDLARRHALAAELLDLAADDDDPVHEFEARHLLFSTHLQRGDGPGVRQQLARMLYLVDRVGDVGRRWAALYASAAVSHLDGDLDRSETLAGEALTTFAAVSPSRAFAAYGGQVLGLRLVQGRVGELHDSLRQLVDDQPAVPAWRAALALACVESDPAGAARLAGEALDVVHRDFLWLASRLVGGRAAAAVADRSVVDAYVDELGPCSGLVSWQGTCSYGPVDTTLAQLHRARGRPGVARTHADLARRVADHLQAPAFHADLDALGW